MIFRPELAALVLSGEKTVTRRALSDNPRSPWWRERCRYQPRQVFAVNPGRGVVRVGDARVVSVRKEVLSRVLIEEEAEREGFRPVEVWGETERVVVSAVDQFVETWIDLHGAFDAGERVWRVEFEVIER